MPKLKNVRCPRVSSTTGAHARLPIDEPCRCPHGGVILPIFLLLLAFPAIAFGWTLNERCELALETPEGVVSAARTEKGILLYFPDGLVANDTRVKVGIGGRNWIVPVIGGGVELEEATEPFLEKNWMTVHADGDLLLGFNLRGTSAAWERLDGCEPARGRGGSWIRLSGEIIGSTDDEMISAIRRQRPEGVMLDSPGGLLAEAQRIGRTVREAGLSTKVEAGGECLSECTFVLAAGDPRIVEEGARVGVRPALVTSGLGVYEREQGPSAETAAYFTRMGVDGGKLAALVTSAAAGDLHVFSRTELRELGLADTGAPLSVRSTVDESASDEDERGGWWWIAGLGGLVAVFWAASKVSSRT